MEQQGTPRVVFGGDTTNDTLEGVLRALKHWVIDIKMVGSEFHKTVKVTDVTEAGIDGRGYGEGGNYTDDGRLYAWVDMEEVVIL